MIHEIPAGILTITPIKDEFLICLKVSRRIISLGEDYQCKYTPALSIL